MASVYVSPQPGDTMSNIDQTSLRALFNRYQHYLAQIDALPSADPRYTRLFGRIIKLETAMARAQATTLADLQIKLNLLTWLSCPELFGDQLNGPGAIDPENLAAQLTKDTPIETLLLVSLLADIRRIMETEGKGSL